MMAMVLASVVVLFSHDARANFASRPRHSLNDPCSITQQNDDGSECGSCRGGPFTRPGCGDLVARGMTFRCTRYSEDVSVYCTVPSRKERTPVGLRARPAETKGWCAATPPRPSAGCVAPAVLVLAACRSRALGARRKRERDHER